MFVVVIVVIVAFVLWLGEMQSEKAREEKAREAESKRFQEAQKLKNSQNKVIRKYRNSGIEEPIKPKVKKPIIKEPVLKKAIVKEITPLIPKIKNRRRGINYSALFPYYPTRYDIPEITYKDIENRKSVWDFKNGKSTEYYAEIFSRLLISLYSKEELKKIILLPIPASTNYKTEIRYKRLMDKISKNIGIINGYSYIKNTTDHEAKHLNNGHSSLISTLKIDNEALRGKNLILIDDVITRGNNLHNLAFRLKHESEVKCLEGLFLAETTHLNY